MPVLDHCSPCAVGASLEFCGVTKTYPGVRALQDVSFTVRPGSVHALLGENGAGKSTLMQILYGVYRKDAGEIRIDGKPCDFQTPRDAIRHGIGLVPEDRKQQALFLALAVSTNLSMASHQQITR